MTFCQRINDIVVVCVCLRRNSLVLGLNLFKELNNKTLLGLCVDKDFLIVRDLTEFAATDSTRCS